MKFYTVLTVVICCIAMLFSNSSVHAQWTLASNSQATDNNFFVQGNKIYVSTYAGLYVSDDDAATWKKIDVPSSNMSASRFVQQGNDYYVAMGDGLYHSTDLVKWTTISPVKDHLTLLAYVSASALYAIDNGQLFVSLNKGGTWSAVTNGIESKKILCMSAIGNVFYCASDDGSIYKSTDNAASWTLQTNLGKLVNVYGFVGKESNVLAYGTSIYRSTDGSTWKDVASSEVRTHGCMDMVDLDSLIITCTSSFGVFASGDKGATWVEVNEGLEDNYIYKLDLALCVKGGNAFVGTDAGFVFKRSLAEIASKLKTPSSVSSTESSFNKLVVNPNPSSEHCVVTVHSAVPGSMLIRVFDQCGRVVLQQDCNSYDDASASVSLSTAALASGVYNIVASGNGSITQSQLVIVRP